MSRILLGSSARRVPSFENLVADEGRNLASQAGKRPSVRSLLPILFSQIFGVLQIICLGVPGYTKQEPCQYMPTTGVHCCFVGVLLVDVVAVAASWNLGFEYFRF